MTILIWFLIALVVVTILMGVILLQHHKRCPKCRRIMVEEEEKVLICRDCGHVVRQKMRKSLFHWLY
jgi:rRNA maturation endonuclease Nob1